MCPDNGQRRIEYGRVSSGVLFQYHSHSFLFGGHKVTGPSQHEQFISRLTVRIAGVQQAPRMISSAK